MAFFSIPKYPALGNINFTVYLYGGSKGEEDSICKGGDR